MSNNLSIGTYVELLPSREDVYKDVPAGARGWVRALDTDEDGFEKVFIEWDRDYWRYHGQEDIWTFADHFKVAEALPDLVLDNQLDTPSTGPCPECGTYHDDLQAKVAAYIDSISDAFEVAAGSDGFLLISLRREVDPLSGIEVFVIDTNRGSMDPDLREIPMSEILRFVEEQKRMRGD